MAEKREKTKTKRGRIAKSIVVLLFAAVLTGIAAFGPDSALGAGGSGNTGKDTKIPISYRYPSSAGGGDFSSDCQGFYFYVTPVDAQQKKLSYFTDSPEAILEGTLAYTDGEDKKTYRQYFIEGDKNIRYRWKNEYNIARFQGYTSVIPQTEESLLFIPYATWTGKWQANFSSNLKSGWKNNIAALCYYNADASTWEKRYSINSNRAYLDGNRVFLDETIYKNINNGGMSEFNSLCTNGVFYSKLAELLSNKDGLDAEKDDTDLIKIDALKKELDTAAGIRNFVNNADLQNKSLKIWDYFLEFTTSGGSLEFNASSRIDEFLTKGYNNYRTRRNAAYDSKNNKIGLNLAGTKYEMKEWTGTDPTAPGIFVNKDSDSTKCEFAEREYNLHYLDLMLTVYAVAVKNNATDEVKNAWEQAIIHYVTGDQSSKKKEEDPDPYSVFGAGAPIISISGGVVARGLQQGSDGTYNGLGACVYVGSQDLINLAFHLENAGTNKPGTVSSDLETNKRSVTKSFLGARTGGSAAEMDPTKPGGDAARQYFMGLYKDGRFRNKVNPEVFKYGTVYTPGKLAKEIQTEKEGNFSVKYIQKVPDYYTSYYKRLKAAVMGGNTSGKSAITNDPITKEIKSWMSEAVYRRLILHYYYRDASGNVEEKHAVSGMEEAIKFTAQRENEHEGYALYGYGNSWGTFYVPSFRFPWIEDPNALTARVTSRLTIRSDLVAQQKKKKNKAYSDMDFMSYKKYTANQEEDALYKNSYTHYFKDKYHDIIADARPLKTEEAYVNGELASREIEPLEDHVQLQANVVYGTAKDKKALLEIYNNEKYNINKDNLYVKLRITRAKKLQNAKGEEVKTVNAFNSSYLDNPQSIGCTFEYKDENGAVKTATKKLGRVKELTRNVYLSYQKGVQTETMDVGCKVDKDQFEALFFPEKGLIGAAITLDVDKSFFEDPGFDVVEDPETNVKEAYIGYQVEIIPCMITAVKVPAADVAREFASYGYVGDEVKELITVKPSNRAGIKYSRVKTQTTSTVELSPDYNYTSIAENYAELKEGEIRCFHLTPMRLEKLYERNYSQPGSYLQNYNALKVKNNEFEPKVYDIRGWVLVPGQSEIASSDALADNHEDIVSALYVSDPSLAPAADDIHTYLDIQEQFEAMCGVPSTRSLYFSTGGSEFIVNLRLNYEANQKAERTYTSHFNSVDCEYKPGDQLKTLKSESELTETFVADASGKTGAYSVLCEQNRAVEPKGYSSKNTTVNFHTSPTKFYAEWKGDIPNETADPGHTGSFHAGTPGSPCAGKDYDEGTQREKNKSATVWDVTKYNEDLAHAVEWARAMEATNADWTVRRIADSDGWERKYAVGDAVITVTLSGGPVYGLDGGGSAKQPVFTSRTLGTEQVTCKYGGHEGATLALKDAKSAGGAYLQGTEEYLGSGWSWDKGEYGKGTGYKEGAHGHGDICPGCWDHDDDPETDPISCFSEGGPGAGNKHDCGEFTPGIDIKDGPSSMSYVIRVEFTHGAFEGNNYDGSEDLYDGLSPAVASGISQMPAHAICGPCCEHVLPAIEDTWTQTLYFDTVAITDMHVWKLESGYVQGVSEIFEGNQYYEQHSEELRFVNDIFDAWDTDGESDYYNERYSWASGLASALSWQKWQEEAAGYKGLDQMDPEYLAVRDRVYSTIKQSDPSIFYNIAAKNLKEYNVPYNTSRTGRLRYSLQTGQDDDVYWEEYTKSELTGAKELHRSNKCDGQDSTMMHCGDEDPSDSPNPSPNGGQGHVHPWSTGCLYSNNKYVNGVDYHKKYMYGGDKTTYNTNTTWIENDLGLGLAHTERNNDGKDRKTQEWKRFEARRNMDVSVTVISDFLILQTSSGDQSPFYWESHSKTVKAQENFDQIDIDPTYDNGGGYAMMVTNNPLHMKMGELVNVGSYNGKYNEPEDKYTGDGFYEGCPVIPTAFDDDAKLFPKTADELEPYDESCPGKSLSVPGMGHAVNVSKDQNISCPGVGFGGYGQLRHERVRGLVLSDNFVQNPSNVNGEYTTGQSYAFYRSLIQWTDGTDERAARFSPSDRRTGSQDTRVRFWEEAAAGDYPDREYGEGMKEFFLADRTDPYDAPSTMAPGYSVKYDRMGYTDAGYMEDKGTGDTRFIEDVARETAGAVLPEDEISSRYLSYLNYRGVSGAGYSYGILRESVYDRTQIKEKCNDIVVYDPISVKYCKVLRKAKHIVNDNIAARYPFDTDRSWLYPESTDQRISGDYEGADDMISRGGADETCPGIPGKCAFRKLVCRYDQEFVRGAFSIDNFERFYTGDGSSYDDSWYSYYIRSSAVNESGACPLFSLDGSRFAIAGDDNKVLEAAGPASLQIPFAKLSVNPSNTSERVLITADITVNRWAKMPLISTDHTRLFFGGDGHLYVETDDGAQYRSAGTIAVGRTYRIGLELCFGDLSDFAVYVDGGLGNAMVMDKDARRTWQWSFTRTKAPSMYDDEVCGADFYLGNREDREYNVYMTADNISVVRLGGTRYHTAACYTEVKHCPTILQDLYNGLKAGSSTIDWYGYENDGSNIVSTTSTSHDHKDGCLNISGQGFNIAYEEGKKDCTSLEKMTGAALWQKIVDKFNLKKTNGKYTLEADTGAGNVMDFGYTGDMQSVTLAPGTYVLEAWGASGSGGAEGGYSSGTIRLEETTTLYIGAGGAGESSTGGFNGGGAAGESSGSGTASYFITHTSYGCSFAGETHISSSPDFCTQCGHDGQCIASATPIQASSTEVVYISPPGGVFPGYEADALHPYCWHHTHSSGCPASGFPFTAFLYGGSSTIPPILDGCSGYTRVPQYDVVMTAGGNTGAGGGATHIAFAPGLLSSLSGDKGSVLLAAGGGGGEHPAAGSDTGGAGGGANLPGGNGSGTGGTLNGGYAFGQGSPATESAGAGGGGYYGGINGGGGSGYADTERLTDIKGTSGANTGNGRVRITKMDCVDKEGLFAFIKANMHLVPDYVTTDRRSIVNPIWICRCRYDNEHVCTDECWTKELSCTEPHHDNGHYDFSSTVCYEACCNDANHKQYEVEDTDHSSETVRADDYILLDNYFDVYFPNLGEYYETDQYGVLNTSMLRGKGYGMPYMYRKDPYDKEESYISGRDYTDYVYRYGHYSGTDSRHACSSWVSYADNPEVREGYHYLNQEDGLHQGRDSIMHMDTTEWTREKWIKFPYITLYNRNGVWEEHAADEWYQIEIFDNDGEVLDTYHFYCPLLNDEMGDAQIQYAVESVNHPSAPESYSYPDYEGRDTDTWMPEEEFREGILALDDITLEADREMPASVKEWLEREPLTITDVLMRMYYSRHWDAAKMSLLERYQDYEADGLWERAQLAWENWPIGGWISVHAWPFEKDWDLTVLGPVDNTNIMNTDRYGWLYGRKYGSWQDVWNDSRIDVIGHIGNLVIEDTNDLRFSNFFKVSTKGWLIDGLVHQVDMSKQNRYLSWWRHPYRLNPSLVPNGNGGFDSVNGMYGAAGAESVPATDIRCEAAGPLNEWYNTYHTQEWTNIMGKTLAEKDNIPVQASRNNINALKDYPNELKLGYNVLWDISSIGNYETGTLQVLPYYYVLNINTGELVPVDVYADSGEQITAINYFGLMDAYASGKHGEYAGSFGSWADAEELMGTLYNYNMHLNWQEEATGGKNRRNYWLREKSITEALAKERMFGVYAFDTDGTPVEVPGTFITFDEDGNPYTMEGSSQLVYNLTIPFGGEFVLGNSQLVRLNCLPDKDELDGGRARTFIGTSTVTALHGDINLHDETNLNGNNPLLYSVHGQRWHLTLGLPSSAQFVAYRNGVHVKPNKLIETEDGGVIYANEEFKADARGNCDWVVLMTADIKVLGSVYNLEYNQGSDNGMYEAPNGNKFYFGDDIPTLIGVYGLGNTTTPDIDIMQTH